MQMRRRALLAGGAGLAAAGLAAPAVAQGAQQLPIATGTMGGVYHPLGGGMASIFSRVIPGMSATVEVTGGRSPTCSFSAPAASA